LGEKYQLMILSIIRRHEKQSQDHEEISFLLDTFGLCVCSEGSSRYLRM